MLYTGISRLYPEELLTEGQILFPILCHI